MCGIYEADIAGCTWCCSFGLLRNGKWKEDCSVIWITCVSILGFHGTTVWIVTIKKQSKFIPNYVSLVDVSLEIEKKLTPQFVNTSCNLPLNAVSHCDTTTSRIRSLTDLLFVRVDYLNRVLALTDWFWQKLYGRCDCIVLLIFVLWFYFYLFRIVSIKMPVSFFRHQENSDGLLISLL